MFHKQRHNVLLMVITSILCVSLGLLVTEYLLRYQRSYIQNSDHMDDGFLRHHPQLGWKTSPKWQGSHRHYDFEVSYSTDPNGYRTTPALDKSRHQRVGWVGDSFTFGLGVDDEFTFINHLNQFDTKRAHLNFGIPGFSTDQELLLVQREVLRFRLATVVLVVYLGNDLLDNLLDYPLQAEQSKPRFIIKDEKLEPVAYGGTFQPRKPKDNRISARSLLMGSDSGKHGWFQRLSFRSELGRRLRLILPVDGDVEDSFEQRLEPALDLFDKLLKVIRFEVEQAGIGFRIVLLPGSSLLQRPQSLSGRYQDYLRRQILQSSKRKNLKVFDIKKLLLDHGSKKLYHSHEGHLTKEGNRIVAKALLKWLNEPNHFK